MAWEIERRYLVRVAPELWAELGNGHHYRQGYVRNGRPSVRIRTGEPRGPVLTTKTGEGVQREEHEAVVPSEIAGALFQAADDRIIEKIRWKLGPWELDRFLGALEGLTLLEIELEAPTDLIPEPPAGVHVLREVTDDNRFVSGRLARLNDKRQRQFVRKAYREVEGWKGLAG